MRSEKKSWEEEHEEVIKRAADIRLGRKWTLGFYQVVPHAEPPETKLNHNSLMEFLVPEEYLSLKLYFDNLRNYGICAAFMALGAWVWVKSGRLLPLQAPSWIPESVATIIWSFTGFLLLLNCLQTWILTTELYYSLRAIRIAKFYVYRGNHVVQMILGLLHMLISAAGDILVRIGALLVCLAIIAISIGFVAYAVLWR